MTNLDEYQLLTEKDELFQKNKVLERAFEMLSEDMLKCIPDDESRQEWAEKLREYWLRKAEEEIK